MKNRWVVLSAGTLIQSVLGGIYAWSTLASRLEADYALSKGQSGFIFGMMIAVFTLVMIAAGYVLTRKGPRFTAVIGALLFMAGYILASFSKGSFPLLVLSLGCIVGAGIGFSYVCPLSAGIKWFPQQKGLVTGITVAGFGGGAVLLSFVAGHFLNAGMDVLGFLRWFGVLSGITLLIGSCFLEDPVQTRERSPGCGFAAIWTVPFCVIVLCMFSGTFAGLLIIGNLVPLLMRDGMLEMQAGLAVALFSVGNALGRIAWGHVFDHIGYRSILLSLVFLAFSCMLLLIPCPIWALYYIVALLGFGFGSNFVVYAAAVSELYGSNSFAKLYPLCFLAYGMAGILGPGFGGYLHGFTDSYQSGLYISIGLLCFSAFIAALHFRNFDRRGEGIY